MFRLLQWLLPEGNLLVNSNLDAVISSVTISSQVLLPASHCFVIGKDLICQLVHKLIKAQIHLGEKKQDLVRVSPAQNSSFLSMQDQYNPTQISHLAQICIKSHTIKNHTAALTMLKGSIKLQLHFSLYSFCMFFQVLVPHSQSSFPLRKFLIFL